LLAYQLTRTQHYYTWGTQHRLQTTNARSARLRH